MTRFLLAARWTFLVTIPSAATAVLLAGLFGVLP